jgi:hypothetical protein
MPAGFRPPGEGWVEGPLFPPDLERGPVETVRYFIAIAGAEDREWTWHRPIMSRGTAR